MATIKTNLAKIQKKMMVIVAYNTKTNKINKKTISRLKEFKIGKPRQNYARNEQLSKPIKKHSRKIHQ